MELKDLIHNYCYKDKSGYICIYDTSSVNAEYLFYINKNTPDCFCVVYNAKEREHRVIATDKYMKSAIETIIRDYNFSK